MADKFFKFSKIKMDDQAMVLALRLMLGVILCILISVYLNLQEPYWAVFTVAACVRSTAGVSFYRAFERLLGTILGGLLGFFLAGFFELNLFGILVGSFLIMFCGQYCFERFGRRYSVTLGTVTALLLFNSVLLPHGSSFEILLQRIAEISVGVMVTFLLSVIFLPKDLTVDINLQIDKLKKIGATIYPLIMNSILIQKGGSEINKHLTTFEKEIDKLERLLELYNLDPTIRFKSKTNIGQSKLLFDQYLILLKDFYFHFCALNKHYWITLFGQPFEILTRNISNLLHLNNHQEILQTYEKINSSLAELNDQIDEMRSRGQFLHNKPEENQALYLFIDLSQNFINLMVRIEEISSIQQTVTIIKQDNILDIEDKKFYLKHSFKTSLGVALAFYCWIWLQWPGGLQGLISSLVISSKNISDEMSHIAIDRLLGCAIGACIGLVTLYLFVFNLMTLLLVMAIFTFIFGYYGMIIKKHEYLFTQATYGLALTLVQAGGPPLTLSPPLERLAGIFIAIICIMLVNKMILPFDALKYYMKKIYYYRYYLLLALKGGGQNNYAKLIQNIKYCEHYKKQVIQSQTMFSVEDERQEQDIKLNYTRLDSLNQFVNFIHHDFNFEKSIKRAERHEVCIRSMLQKLAIIVIPYLKQQPIDHNKIQIFRNLIDTEILKIRKTWQTYSYSRNDMAELNHFFYRIKNLINIIETTSDNVQ